MILKQGVSSDSFIEELLAVQVYIPLVLQTFSISKHTDKDTQTQTHTDINSTAPHILQPHRLQNQTQRPHHTTPLPYHKPNMCTTIPNQCPTPGCRNTPIASYSDIDFCLPAMAAMTPCRNPRYLQEQSQVDQVATEDREKQRRRDLDRQEKEREERQKKGHYDPRGREGRKQRNCR